MVKSHREKGFWPYAKLFSRKDIVQEVSVPLPPTVSLATRAGGTTVLLTPSRPSSTTWPASQLSKLQKVKTDIGRGRAWIRLALNEASMEAYMRNFLEDVSCRMLLLSS